MIASVTAKAKGTDSPKSPLTRALVPGPENAVFVKIWLLNWQIT